MGSLFKQQSIGMLSSKHSSIPVFHFTRRDRLASRRLGIGSHWGQTLTWEFSSIDFHEGWLSRFARKFYIDPLQVHCF